MKWFTGCTTPAEVRREYHRLAMIYHPDRGGDTAVMQEINAAYESKLKSLDGYTSKGTDGQEHVYHWNERAERATMAKLAELLGLSLPGCRIRLIGVWLWVDGNTRPNRAALKGAGLKWHSKRLAWYFKPYGGRTRYNRRATLEDLAEIYGVREFAGGKGRVVVPA